MPSHQTSPSSVSATLVKITSRFSDAMQLGLVLSLVPGRDAKVAGLGVDRVEAAVGTGLDPGDVVADGRDLPAVEAGRAGSASRSWSCRRRSGSGRDVVLAALGRSRRRGSACARPASPGRGPWSRRCAARSTSCRAARCRRSPSRSTRSRASPGSGRCTWSRCTARARRSGRRRAARRRVCMQGTKSPSAPSTSSTARPMRVMIRMLTATYGAVGQLDADLGDRRAERAHRERHHVHRAAAHAAGEQRLRRPVCSSARISAGAIQLLVGPASSLLCVQMKVRSSTRATSLGSLQREVAVGPQLRVQLA